MYIKNVIARYESIQVKIKISRRRSSVVEHFIGNEEVGSSILLVGSIIIKTISNSFGLFYCPKFFCLSQKLGIAKKLNKNYKKRNNYNQPKS
jgi:hypothetical protein